MCVRFRYCCVVCVCVYSFMCLHIRLTRVCIYMSVRTRFTCVCICVYMCVYLWVHTRFARLCGYMYVNTRFAGVSVVVYGGCTEQAI